MFALVGVGVAPGYITQRALEVLREAHCAFYEDYTGPLDAAWLQAAVGRPLARLARRDLEDLGGRPILDCLRRGQTAALAVAGDPMTATAHAALVAAVRGAGYPVEVVPGVSVVCAAMSAACLSIYRLGGVATVTYPRGGVYSERPYHVAEGALARDMHALLLLDVRDDGGFMTPAEAAQILAELERRVGRGVFRPDRQVVVVHRLGWQGGGVVRTTLERLAASQLQGPAVVIVPSRLGPVEAECA